MIKPIRSRMAREVEAHPTRRGCRLARAEYCRVYIVITEPINDVYFFKIGISRTPEVRIASLQSGCPIRFRRMHWAEVYTRKTSWAVEAYLHVELEMFHVTGEWFRRQGNCPDILLESALRSAARVIGGSIEVYSTDIDGITQESAEKHRARHRAILRNQIGMAEVGSGLYLIGDSEAGNVKVVYKKQARST